MTVNFLQETTKRK